MWINAALFQAGWIVCVMERGLLALGATLLILAIHGYRYRRDPGEWSVIAGVGLLGIAQDTLLMHAGVLQFTTQLLPPLWLICIWMLFATTLQHSFHWLHNRKPVAAILGAVAGPLSYLAGERLGALTINHEWLPALAATWALAMPGFLLLNQSIREARSSCHA